MPFEVLIVGYDSKLNSKSERFVSLKNIIQVVDTMPLRIKEKGLIKVVK